MSNKGFINNDFAFGYEGVNVTNFKTVKITKAHDDDLFDDTGTTRTVTIWTQPKNSRLISAMMRLSTQFAGVSLTDLNVDVGVSGNLNGLLTISGNLINNAVGTEYRDIGDLYDVFTEGIHGKTTASKIWQAKSLSGGANLDASTAGILDFYFVYEE